MHVRLLLQVLTRQMAHRQTASKVYLWIQWPRHRLALMTLNLTVLELGYESSRDAYQCTDIPTPVWGRIQPSHCGESGIHCQGKCQAMTQSSSFASEQAHQA